MLNNSSNNEWICNEPKKKVAKKEIIYGVLIICAPLIVFFSLMIIPSFYNDIDAKVLLPDILLFLGLSLCALILIIVYIVDIILNKNSIKHTIRNVIIKLVILVTIGIFSFASYIRAEDAFKDFNAEDTYIVAIVEKTTIENDGSKPTVTFKDDNNIYYLWQLDSNIKEGKAFKFKYYKNSNLLYLIEEVVC